jgi:hypothetical protein
MVILPRGHAVKGMVIWDRYEPTPLKALKGGDDNAQHA